MFPETINGQSTHQGSYVYFTPQAGYAMTTKRGYVLSDRIGACDLAVPPQSGRTCIPVS